MVLLHFNLLFLLFYIYSFSFAFINSVDELNLQEVQYVNVVLSKRHINRYINLLILILNMETNKTKVFLRFGLTY